VRDIDIRHHLFRQEFCRVVPACSFIESKHK